MSQTHVTVPDLGGIDEVEVIEISVSVGDALEAEQELLVLESDKATMEVPAPQAGKIIELLVSVGDKVSSGSQVAIMETEAQVDSPQDSQPVVAAAQATPEPEQTPVAAAPVVTVESTEMDLVVPDLGGASEVEIIELSVSPGDSLEAEDSLLVLESDKATMEVPSPQSGELISFSVKVGDTVSEGDVIGKLKTAAASATAAAGEASTEPAQSAAPTQTAPTQAAPAVNKPAPVTSNNTKPSTGKGVHAGPAVRMLARELGVELAQVTGTGPRGRILKEDLHGFVKQRVNQPAAAVGLTLEVRGSDEDFSRYGPIEEVALNKIKRVTAKNMLQSWSSIPQVTQFDEADITDLENYRKQTMGAQLAEGEKVSPLAFIAKACAKALQKFPQFNSSLNADGSGLVLKQFYNIGIAVDTPDGLLVPVIKGVDQMGVVDIANASRELAQKARDKKLAMDAMSGGCFTISSLGGIGGTSFTPIVTAPQVAILGVSKAIHKPVWNGTSFEPRLMLPLSLSYDHRVIDGAEAARFARYLCDLLSDVRHLLL